MSSRPKDNRVPMRLTPIRMRGRIGQVIVRAQIGLNLHNPACQELPLSYLSEKDFTEEPGRNQLRRRLKKRALQPPAQCIRLQPLR